MAVECPSPGQGTVAVSLWVHKLLPISLKDPRRGLHSRVDLVRAAIIAGTQSPLEIITPQVSFVRTGAVHYGFAFELQELLALREFQDRIKITSFNSILRTALMLGLQLPYTELGVMSETRSNPISYSEWMNIFYVASRVSSRYK